MANKSHVARIAMHATKMRFPPKTFFGLDKPKRTLFHLAAALAIALPVQWAFPRYRVSTQSMAPTIPPGSWVLSVRKAVIPFDVGRQDIVVFAPVEGISPFPWIHRVVALGGDEVNVFKGPARKDVGSDGMPVASVNSNETVVVPDGFLYQKGDAIKSYHGLVPSGLVQAKVLWWMPPFWRRAVNDAEPSDAAEAR